MMKSTATASYKAVPSMLTVAPSGKTDDRTGTAIPIFSSAAAIVAGSVAALEEVEYASNCGSAAPRANGRIRMRARNLTMPNWTTTMCAIHAR